VSIAERDALTAAIPALEHLVDALAALQTERPDNSRSPDTRKEAE
jgi:hypothetical protein